MVFSRCNQSWHTFSFLGPHRLNSAGSVRLAPAPAFQDHSRLVIRTIRTSFQRGPPPESGSWAMKVSASLPSASGSRIKKVKTGRREPVKTASCNQKHCENLFQKLKLRRKSKVMLVLWFCWSFLSCQGRIGWVFRAV